MCIALILLSISVINTAEAKSLRVKIFSVACNPEEVKINPTAYRFKVNASFFSVKTGEPLGTLIINGIKKQHNIYNRPALAIRRSGASIEIIPDTNTPKDILNAVGGSLTLVKNSNYTVFPQNNFSKQFLAQKVNRTAVGIRKDGKVVFCVATNVSLLRMAAIMKSLGCIDALSLDGGSSSYMEVNGKHLISGREVPVYIGG